MHRRTVQHAFCVCSTSVAASERWVSHLSKPEERGYAEKLLLPEGGPSIHDGASLGVRGLSDTLTDPAQASSVVRVRVGVGLYTVAGSKCLGRRACAALSAPNCWSQVRNAPRGLGYPALPQPKQLTAQERPLVAFPATRHNG